MLPSKFGSVRQQKQPTERRTSLRLDASIVTLRYEKTVPAEPPILIVSRDPARLSRRPSSSSASSHSSRHRPIVIVPPGIVAPPAEEHPALRGSSSASASSSSSPTPRASPVSVEEWKRDSGVARNKSTSTIHEEEGEDDYTEAACKSRIPAVGSTVSSLVSSVMSQPSTTAQRIDDPFVDDNSIFAPLTTTLSDPLCVVYNPRCTTPPPPPPPQASHSDTAAPLSLPSPATATPTAPATPTRPSRTAPTVPFSIPYSECVAGRVPSSPTYPPTFGRRSHQSPRHSIQSSPRTSCSSSPPTTSRGLSPRSGSRFGIFSQMFTPTQPLWRGTASTSTSNNCGDFSACSSASSTPTASAQSTVAAAVPTPEATACATVNATATDPAVPMALTGSELEQTHSSEKEQGSSHFWNRSRSASTISNKNSTSTATSVDPTTISSDCDLPFVPIDVSIPCDNLLDDAFMNTVSFSNRGSIMLGAQDAALVDGAIQQCSMASTSIDSSSSASASTNADTLATPNNDESDAGCATPTPTPSTAAPRSVIPTPTTPTTPKSQSQDLPRPSDESNDMNNPVKEADDGSPQDPSSTPNILVLAADVEKESQKVRSLYTVGDGSHGEPGKRRSYCERLEPTPEVPSEENELDPAQSHLSPAWQMPASGSSSSLRSRVGGLEDWNDLEGAHVDRYGFITLPPPPGTRIGTPTETRSASGSPRKRSILQRRDPYSLTSTLSGSGRRTPTRKVSARSLNTQTSELSVSTSLRSSRSVIRQASNLLPHNRDRRWMDEAGDMLDAAPSLQDIVDEIQAEKLTEVMKRKEWERSEKWRRMAKVVRKGGEGEGMEFEFDTKNPKLIERTWKGIPDRWRAAAWWSFMATSARAHEGMMLEDNIVAEFHRLQLRSSPDDVQIDLDVPRTISRHIMFRRRYRGGQRLLFRVLHAISIYYPETGYVQGMASLAATLLCYFDEEKCFVMLVRMWQLRGLARLYRPGFEELMAAMSDFSKHWLHKEVASKLDELCIDTTAYGTRWYLTLFNLSVPFPAQLRIWDVFLLLGDGSSATSEYRRPESKSSSSGEYDVLHATSAALAQALREVLLDAEFENAMKALTSSIPVKDEDLLMKVVKAEYKQHHGKKRT
ncbi:uncharacterized protein FTOL_04889 [Fusarium torulosum]|uniref:Rab-GAP TBC domain-containing protein n=1 Tax=Fusarium torulosum TaxID=33205 RepID=A0AAE8M827_9HYPO|nr:uncharacterized protein FTOL_04889 [Fusarium torulosum]